MTPTLQHPMKPDLTVEEAARGRFVSGIRSLILNDLAADMRAGYDKRAEPAFRREHGRSPETSREAHLALTWRSGLQHLQRDAGPGAENGLGQRC